ncbi:MAG: PAS domain S-box protein [Gammaproteobacteria bacterium]
MHSKLLVILDREGRIQRFNAACEALTGYAESEVRGRTCWDFLVPAEEIAGVRDNAFAALVEGSGRTEIRTYTNSWQARDGGRHLIRWRNALVHDEADQVVQVLCVGETLAPLDAEIYRDIVRSDPECVKLLDAECRILDINDAGLAMLGLADLAAARGRCLLDFVAPSYHAMLLRDVRAALRGETAVHRFRSVCSGGAPRWLEQRLVPLNGSCCEGRMRCVLAISRDITAEHEKSLLLSTSNQMLEAVFDSTPLCIAYLDRELNFVKVNQAYADCDGGTPEDFVGQNHFARYPDADNERLFRAAMASGVPYRVQEKPFEYAYAQERGVSYWDWSLVPVRGDGDGIIGAVLSLLDVTERVEAARALRARNSALADDAARSHREARALGRRADLILETALDGFVTLEADGTIIDVNQAYCDLLGRGAAEIVGSNIAEHHVAEGDVTTRHRNAEILAAGALRFEARHRHADGHLIDVAVSVRVAEADGRPLFFAFVCDISPRKRAEQALLESTREAERANRAKSEFLSRMSHELRTPMNAILGYAQIIKASCEDVDQREYAGEIEAAASHLGGLINDLLDISRLESGQLPLDIGPVDIHGVVLEALQIVMPLVSQYQVNIDHGYREARPLRGDRVRIRQILVNLLSNAVKYGHAGGVVRITSEVTGADRLKLIVSDRGPGVAVELLEDLFVPFRRLGAERGPVDGTGIGLTLSRQLARQMGGDLSAEIRVGGGLHLVLEMPLALEAGRPHRAADHPVPALPAGRHRVLYVEDNGANMRLLQAAFSREPDIELLCAADGQQGMAMLRRLKPDIVLLDIHLPDVDGYTVLAAIRADGACRDLPVVALSADAMPHDVARGERAGFDAYLAKPVDILNLRTTLARLLRAKPGA